MTALLLADHDGKTLKDSTVRALTAALKISPEVHLLVAGQDVGPASAQATTLVGAARVLVADSASLAHQFPEALADLVVSLHSPYDTIVAPATAFGKDVAPRIAALLDVMQVSDITAVVSPDTFERPVYAGNAIQVVQATDPVRVVTVRTAAFEGAPDGGSAAVENVAIIPETGGARFIDETNVASERPDLASAKIVVSGGRALRSSENFVTYIEPVADRLGAAIGASRAAVDAGYAPNNWQVGQTGKVVAPDLYIAAGISGAIQHLAGMKDSKVIVAINNDPEAPIFQIADYGLVEDLFVAMPALVEELDKLQSDAGAAA